MSFNSFQYLLFFSCTAFCYYIMPFRWRWIILLSASYYFYISWNLIYSLILFIITSTTYFCAAQIPRVSSLSAKKTIFIIGLLINLSFIFFFKYFNFINEAIKSFVSCFILLYPSVHLNLLVPIGISFYTFRALSYLIDVYRGTVQPEKHFGIFALYVSFFPSLLAGPIDRAQQLIPQFLQEHKLNPTLFSQGIQLILLGFFKKVVIADRLGIYVDSIYNSLTQQSSLNYLMAAYGYTFQIYCDFSGYTDIAIGCAAILGFNLNQNFNLPYISTTITEFWRRWHITLSFWFRDYLYISLGGNRKGSYRTLFNILITMLICGLWHGAAWTFIFWGSLHGMLLCLSRVTLQIRNQIYTLLKLPGWIIRGIRIIITFHLVCLLWIFFRAKTINDAFIIISGIFNAFTNATNLANQNSLMPMEDVILISSFLIVVFIYEVLKNTSSSFLKIPYIKFALFTFIFWITFMWGAFSNQQFIYFQF